MRTIRNLTLSVTLIALFGLSGCSKKTAQESIAEAERLIQSNDFETAVIELKNAVSQESENANARAMLGQVYVQLGEFESADKELERSIRLGTDESDISVDFIRTKIRLLKEFAVRDAAEQVITSADTSERAAETLYYAAKFATETQDAELSQLVLNYLNSSMAESRFTKLANTWKLYADGTFIQAEQALKELRDGSPDWAEAFLLSSFVASELTKFEETKEHAQSYLKLRKYDADVRVHLANSLIQLDLIEEAESELAILSKANKDDPITNMLLASIRYGQRDFQASQELAEKSLLVNPTIARSEVIAGMSAFQLDKFEQAYFHLTKVADELPADHRANRVLQSLRLRLGYVNELVGHLDSSGTSDSEIVASTALALLEQGDADKAAQFKQQLSETELEQETSLSKRGLLKIALDDDTGFTDLEAAVQRNQDDPRYRYLLVTEYIGANQLDNALRALDEWIAHDDKSDSAWFYKGLVYKEKSDYEKTLEAFNNALAINENNIGSLLNLAFIEVASKEFATAQQRFNKVLSVKPRNLLAIMHLQEMAKATGDMNVAVPKLNELITQDPNNLAARVGLARTHINGMQLDVAENLLNDAPASQRSNPALQSMIAELHIRNSEFEQAETLAQRLSEQNRSSSAPYRILIKALELQRKYDEALEATKEGASKFKDEIYYKERLAYFHALNKQYSDAQIHLDALPDYPMSDEPIEVSKARGMVALANNDTESAIEHYYSIYRSAPSEANALNLANLFQSVDKDAEAIQLLSSYGEASGDTPVLKAMRAQIYVDSDPKQAISLYDELLKASPQNPVFLNNLAQAYDKAGDLPKAIEMARMAYAARNDIMLIWDTLGYLLLKNGEFDEAITLLESAHLKTNNLEVTMHYIEALIKTGRTPEAERLLRRVNPSSQKLKDKLAELQSML